MTDYASFTLQSIAGNHSDIHASLTTALATQTLALDGHQDLGLHTYTAGDVQLSAYQQSATDAVWIDYVVDTSRSSLEAGVLVSSLKALWNTPRRVLLSEWRSGPDKLSFPANSRKTLRSIRDDVVWWDYMSLPTHHFAGHRSPVVDPDAPEEDVRDMEAITADQIVTEFVKPVGSTNKNLRNVDGSVTPVVCEFGPPTTGRNAKDNYISTIVFVVEDQDIANNQFGGLGARLTNGLKFQVVDKDDNVLKVFNDNVPVKDMVDLANLCGSVPNFDDQVTGLDSYVIEWSMTEHTGGFLLALRPGDRFQVIVADDLTALTNFTCLLKGTLAL